VCASPRSDPYDGSTRRRRGRRSRTSSQARSSGYGVDAGTGWFADVATLRAFDECGEDASDELMAAMDRTYENTWSWADVNCGDSGENIIAFSSGYGDGLYASFWGLDEEGAPVCLVTDFGLCEVAWDRT
jgi:hypothetical protein